VRDFKHARNERATYFGFANWHRELGELNCGHCGHSTTHALLEDPGHRDIHDEMQRVALGEDIKGWDSAKLRRQYREGGLPRNPYLSHRWWIADQDKARAAGASQVTALCGELVDLPEPESANVIPRTDELTAPSEVRDMDYEDPETGLWWVDMDCVDCLRVSNVKKLARIRNELMHELLHLAARTDELGAAEVAEIRERIKLSRSDGNRSGESPRLIRRVAPETRP
jgi:hypothetical protein